MTNILLSSANQFGHFSRIAIQNENKKMIGCTIQQYIKMFPTLGRNFNLNLKKEDLLEEREISNKFVVAFKHVQKYKWIEKKKFASIIDRIDSAHVITEYQASMLLTWCNEMIDCLPSDKVKLGESLWSLLNACNFTLNVSHYNTLLTLYVQNEWDFSPMKLLLEMKNNNVHPNECTYQTCLEYYCMKGNLSEALMLLENMQMMRIPLVKSIFNLLLIGYSQSGNIEGAFAVVRSMKLKNIELTAETYTAIMCAYAKVNNFNKIKNVIQTCISKNIHFTNDYILNVIYTIAANYNISQETNAIFTIKMICQCLIKKFNVSNDEIRLLLKLAAINKINIVIIVLFHIGLDNDTSEFKNIMRLILQQAVNKDMGADKIVKLCTYFSYGREFKKPMLMSLYYALLKNNHISLPLLRECKLHYIIKPHYFWPLLIKQAYKYDLQGILNVIKIMINDFNVLPCIDTITNYVLPFTFGKISYVKDVLMKYGINESVINNAYVLLMLNKFLIKEAAIYIRNFPGNYFYKIIAHDLRYTSVYKNDVHNFVYISCNLIENVNLDRILEQYNLGNESFKTTFVSMDKQLRDLMIDFPGQKVWFKKVLKQLNNKGINLKSETMQTVHEFLQEHRTDDVIYSN